MDLDFIRTEITETLIFRAKEDAAKRCQTGNFLANTRYIPYFSLTYGKERKNSLAVIYLSANGKIKSRYYIAGRDVADALKRPGIFNTLAEKCSARYAVVCLSSPDGYGIKNAVDAANTISVSMKKTELYDFIFIDKGELFSFREEFLERR